MLKTHKSAGESAFWLVFTPLSVLLWPKFYTRKRAVKCVEYNEVEGDNGTGRAAEEQELADGKYEGCRFTLWL